MLAQIHIKRIHIKKRAKKLERKIQDKYNSYKGNNAVPFHCLMKEKHIKNIIIRYKNQEIYRLVR